MPSSTSQIGSTSCSDKSKIKDDTINKWRKERCSSAGAFVPQRSEDVGRDVSADRRSLPPKAPSATGRLQRDRRATKNSHPENIPRLSLPVEDEVKNEDPKDWFVPNLPVESASDSQLRKPQVSTGLQRTTLTYSETIRSSHVTPKMDVKRSAGESPTKRNNLESRPSKSSLNAVLMAESVRIEDNNMPKLPVTNSLRKDDTAEMKSIQDSSIEELDVNLNGEYELPKNWEMDNEQHHVLYASNASEDIISSVEDNEVWTKGDASDASCCSLSQEDSDVDEIQYFTLDSDPYLRKLNHPNPLHPAKSPFKHPFLHEFNTSRSEPIFSQKSSVPSQQSPLILPQRSFSAPSLPACQHAELGQKWSVCTENGELFLSFNLMQLMTVFALVFFAYLIYLHCK